LGNPLYVPWCLEGLAGVAPAQSRCQQAARLCAARNALMSQIRSTLTPADSVRYAETLAAIEAALGDDGFVAARAATKDQHIDDVITEALTIG
jgi:hypothetical protein